MTLMKAKQSSLLDFSLVVVLLLLLSACAPSEKSFQVKSTGVGVVSGSDTVVSSSQYLGCNSSVSESFGRVYGGSSVSSEAVFTQQVKDFVSSFLSPNAVGTVSPLLGASTGIELSGHLSFDNQGLIKVESSDLSLMIYDSHVGQIDSSTGKAIQPIPVLLSKPSEGRWNRTTGQFSVKFTDKYGDVVIAGNIQKGTTSGEIRYSNKLAVDGGSAKSGTLGVFYIYSCGFIY